MIKALLAILAKWWSTPTVPDHVVVTPAPKPVPAPLPNNPIITMPDKIYQFAKSCLGKDIAATQDELGCAESVSFVLKQCGVAGFPKAGILGTAEFYAWLKKNATEVSAPLPGDIIISPSGSSTKGTAHGHMGVVAQFGVLSNNSMNGLFQETYTLQSWDAFFGDKFGFPVYFFRLS